jgi:hypothetical protein
MIANKKTNGGKKGTAKNAESMMTESVIAAKTTTKKVDSKKIGAKKTRTKSGASSIVVPAFYPKHEMYRLADIVATQEFRKDKQYKDGGIYMEDWEEDSDGNEEYVGTRWVPSKGAKETLEGYIHRLFPTSIASQYLRKTQRTNNMPVLSNLIDEYVTEHNLKTPADDVMVVHLRVGDVIDGTDVPLDEFFNRRVNSWYALFGNEPCSWSPVYVRCLASFDRVLKKTTELGFHKISLVYGFHIKNQSIKKSKLYIAGLVEYAQSRGFEVEMITHADADVSFSYACNAKHFIPGGGGFSKLMAKVVKHKGNDVYHVRV